MEHSENDTTMQECPGQLSLLMVRDIMQLLSGRWKMQIVVFLLNNGTTRFMDLQRGVSGISARVLSKDLQELEQSQLVLRKAKDPKLSIVDYELTSNGRDLEPVIKTMAAWGTNYFNK
ncbi:winged helix-turn-helix transcriptional regulator [Flavobacterium pectinovorum]|uniref:Transcriptional regulator, HxlR family n=1 Tax=Flavobacterium pectinovorum TaxID=29533 RepID=A0AB36P6R8_9FLAO|nr:helix-turn-helix domain-containing protein [Flavobacterium pectinovorum]OXB07747.1 hypothetical protein B0A72_02455 [Flavobacterium pectinovorum]SHM79113.1 transcriptional regulator, HxlR family [Flavobacterium pectinovorum]